MPFESDPYLFQLRLQTLPPLSAEGYELYHSAADLAGPAKACATAPWAGEAEAAMWAGGVASGPPGLALPWQKQPVSLAEALHSYAPEAGTTMTPAYVDLAYPCAGTISSHLGAAHTDAPVPKIEPPPGLEDVVAAGKFAVPKRSEAGKQWNLHAEAFPARAETSQCHGGASLQRARAPPKLGAPKEEKEVSIGASGAHGLPAPPMKPLEGWVTTLVVQNLPGRYTQEDVMKVWPVDGTFDYMHIPYNLLQKRPLGYIFINFLTHELAKAFQRKWHGQVLPSGCNRKPLDIGAAEIQGRRANLELIKTRKIGQLEKAGFLPLVLNGRKQLDSKAIVAELAGMRSTKNATESKAPRGEVAAPNFHLVCRLGPTPVGAPASPAKEDSLGDADSDAATTATGTECSLSDQQWYEEISRDVATLKATRQALANPMYVFGS